MVTGADSGGDRKLVLLYRFLHPGPQTRFLEGLEKCLLGAVVLHRCLLRLMVTAGPYSADPQGRRQLLETKDSVSYKGHKKIKLRSDTAKHGGGQRLQGCIEVCLLVCCEVIRLNFIKNVMNFYAVDTLLYNLF